MNELHDPDGDVRGLLERVHVPSGTALDVDDIVRSGRRRRRYQRTAQIAGAVVVTAAVVGVAATINLSQDERPIADPLISPGSDPATTTSGSVPCTSEDLTVQLGDVGGAMGTTYHGVRATNRGSGKCTLGGFAKVTFSGGNLGGAVYQAGKDRGSATTVKLAAGRSATFQIAVGNPDNYTNGCAARTPSQVNVYVPRDSTTPVTFNWDQQICTDNKSAVYVTPYIR
ncbi:MAG TPA: DUF4232 domain-containing protein [Actinomycetes bacterium]|nr:DUF4232 domain-containing protein [Actinomycetes bacterium]